jgi:hypothetical protein
MFEILARSYVAQDTKRAKMPSVSEREPQWKRRRTEAKEAATEVRWCENLDAIKA